MWAKGNVMVPVGSSGMGNTDSARDAVNEGFARALHSRSEFRGGSLAAWVSRRQQLLRD